MEGWKGKRMCYSLAGLPYLENWGNLKGIVLNLHHSAPSQSAATLCSSLKYASRTCSSASVCLAALHTRMEQQSSLLQANLTHPSFISFLPPPPLPVTESLFKRCNPDKAERSRRVSKHGALHSGETHKQCWHH